MEESLYETTFRPAIQFAPQPKSHVILPLQL
jgi:hypothetical protein